MSPSRPKRLAILGSTGSIGRNALSVVESARGAFQVYGLSAMSNVALLAEQAEHFGAARVVLAQSGQDIDAFEGSGVEVEVGSRALESLAADPGADLVVNALVGVAGLRPTVAAVRAGKSLALANKESLVMAGQMITALAASSGSCIVPVDSEHSAIFRCLRGRHPGEVSGLVLTASGGALRDVPVDELDRVTVDEALAHPTWSMGRKITVDSATFFNKGMEVIEAHWLFGIPLDDIEVVVHRESVVHSLVLLADGSMIAQLGAPDMRVPIQYALFYPDAPEGTFGACDLAGVGSLTFEAVDPRRHPCLELAIESARMGGTASTVAVAADEVAVDAFLSRKIDFGDIATVIDRTLAAHVPDHATELGPILASEDWARATARDAVERLAAARA